MTPSPDQQPSQLSLDALARLQVPSDFHVSPDGTKVVYALRSWTRDGEHATSSIWIADIGRGNSARQLTSGLFHDEQPRWCPNGQCIAFKSDRSKPGDSSAIYLLSLTGGEAYPITPPENKKQIASFEWSPNGKFIAYLSSDEKTEEQLRKENDKDDAKVWGEEWEYQRLRYVHVDNRQVTTILSGKRQIHLFSWCPTDSQTIVYLEHQTPDINSSGLHGAQLATINLATGTGTDITHFPGPVSQLVWAKDAIYFTAGVVPEHCSTAYALYQLSTSEKTYERAHFGDENCCVGLRSGGPFVSVRVQWGLHDEIYAIRRAEQPILLQRGFNAIDNFHVVQPHGRGDYIVAFSKGDGCQPEEVYSTTGSSPPVQLSNHNAAIAEMKISQARFIHATASDGYDLYGMLFLPSSHHQETTQNPLPTILMIHGGPYWRVTNGFSVCHYLEVPLLVSAGYAVLCPNYRGSSGRGQRHAAFARARMGTVDYTDSIAILRAGIDQGLVDGNRVAIGGWSQGGFLSYLAVTRNDFTFRGAVCGAGVVDWDMLTMTSDAYWFEADLSGGAPWEVDSEANTTAGFADDRDRDRDCDTVREMTTTKKKNWIRDTAGRHGSALWHMKNVRTPVLILHGEEDVRVPLSQAVAFYRACLHHNVPVKMVTYPREGHFLKERKHVIDLWSRMREFYDLHLA